MRHPARRRRILDQLGVVSRRLERLLGGQEVQLGDLPLPQDADPREPPLSRLRRFKETLQEALRQLERDEPRACGACGAPLPELLLDELPWADRCQACGSVPCPPRAGG